jgi:hypothetical protein
MSKTRAVEAVSAPSYHDLHITTAKIPRTSIFNLPHGYEVSCNRVGGWCLWVVDSDPPYFRRDTLVAGEYDAKGLRLDVGGVVICDSLTKPPTP